MVVSLDGIQVLSVPVAATAWTDYSVSTLQAAGRHTVAVAFLNDFGSGCDRNLRVDKLSFSP